MGKKKQREPFGLIRSGIFTRDRSGAREVLASLSIVSKRAPYAVEISDIAE
jgi:hypothetical protein